MTRPRPLRLAKPAARRAKPTSDPDGCQMCGHEQLLGEIQGTLNAVVKTLDSHGQKLDKMDDRLRSVENKGAIAGAAAAVMVALGLDLVKGILTRGRG